MVDPIFTYVGGIAFLVLIIGSMLYLMYDYEGVDEEDTANESVVRGAGPVAAEGGESESAEAVDGGAEDTREAREADPEAGAEPDEGEAADDEEETADADDA